jgi:hypothetical protein
MFTCLRSALLAAAAVALSWPALADGDAHLRQTNDIDRMEEEDGRGGFARLAALVKAERAKGGPTFFVHSGDTLSPSLLSGIDKGAHIIDVLNHMDVDVMVPGNHEFDFGPDVFRERLAEATFPVVSSNITEADGSAPKNTVDHKIVDVNGIKVGFYGLTPRTRRSSRGRATSSSPLGRGRHGAGRSAPGAPDFVVAVVHTDQRRLASSKPGRRPHPVGTRRASADLLQRRVAPTESDRGAISRGHGVRSPGGEGRQGRGVLVAFRIVDTADVAPDQIAAPVAGW